MYINLKLSAKVTLFLEKITNFAKMKRFVLIFFSLFSLIAQAQKANKKTEPFNLKKTLKEIRSYEKEDNYSKVHETLQSAFTKWPETNSNARLWHYEMQAQAQLAKAENTKLFLNSKPDTASYFTHVLQTYQAGLRCDSLDRLPNKKGRIEPQFTHNISETLTAVRNNLRSGGRYFYLKKRYADAYHHFDTYLQTIGSPLLLTSSPAYAKAKFPLDQDSMRIAALAVFAAHQSENAHGVLKYAPCAEQDTAHRAALIEMRAQAHCALTDTATYYTVLRQGFSQYPTDRRFYTPLIDHYNATHEFQQSLSIVDTLVSLEPENDIYLSLKGKLFEAMNLPDSAEVIYQQIVFHNDSLPEVYASLGNVYIEQAHQFALTLHTQQGTKQYYATKAKIKKRYTKARAALERARQLSPLTPTLWRNGLREVYFKLNDGKALKALEN